MAAYIPEEGELARLQLIKDNAVWQVLLFTNTPTIDGAVTLLDLDEATFDGYERKDLDSWDDPAIDAGIGAMTHPQLAWALGTPPGETIEGYAVIDDDAKVVSIKMLSAPRTLVNTDDQITLDLVEHCLERTEA